MGISFCYMDRHPPSSHPVHCLGNKPGCGAYRLVRRPSTGAEMEGMASGRPHAHSRCWETAVAAVASHLRVGSTGPDVVTQDPNCRPATANPFRNDKLCA